MCPWPPCMCKGFLQQNFCFSPDETWHSHLQAGGFAADLWLFHSSGNTDKVTVVRGLRAGTCKEISLGWKEPEDKINEQKIWEVNVNLVFGRVTVTGSVMGGTALVTPVPLLCSVQVPVPPWAPGNTLAALPAASQIPCQGSWAADRPVIFSWLNTFIWSNFFRFNWPLHPLCQ